MDDVDKTVVIGSDGASADFGKCPVCGGALEPDPQDPDSLRCPVCRFSQRLPDSVAPGRVVGGKFRVLAPLGKGGNGEIFLCHPLDDAGAHFAPAVRRSSSWSM